MSEALLFALLKGIAVGIVIALPVGPVGVLCVRRTLFEGPTYGFVSGLGAAAADTIFGVVAGFGITIVRDFMLRYQDWFAAAGGLFLLYVGAKALLEASDTEPEPVDDEAQHLGAFVSTFALTITNPITILAFAGIFAKVGVSKEAGVLDVGVLVAGVFLGSLLWWLGLSFGIAGLRRVGTVRLVWLNRISGAILALSGLGLLGAALLAFAGVSL
jgi:threonine/homoserine/homoserine lactone efflux protein